MNDVKEIARSTRTHRKLHRIIGSFLLIFFFVIALSGLLLGWKKHSGGVILPATEKGTSTNLKEWLSYDSLYQCAIKALRDSLPGDLSPTLDRIDARPSKGIIKFVFADHYHEIQVDGATGNVLAVNHRNSDLLEQIHDGSILDNIFSTSNNPIKLSYTSMMGVGLLFLSFTGFWLWYNPKRMRKKKEQPE